MVRLWGEGRDCVLGGGVVGFRGIVQSILIIIELIMIVELL